MQTPSVGRIVHYVDVVNGTHDAAIITRILDVDYSSGVVGLVVFPFNRNDCKFGRVLYDARMSPGTWHYPEIVNTVSCHESENEEEKREGPISNSPETE